MQTSFTTNCNIVLCSEDTSIYIYVNSSIDAFIGFLVGDRDDNVDNVDDVSII